MSAGRPQPGRDPDRAGRGDRSDSFGGCFFLFVIALTVFLMLGGC